jgi:hypothetical protein
MLAFVAVCALLLLSLVAQPFLPPLDAGSGATALLFPVVLFFGALAFPYPLVLLLTLASGLAWDLLTLPAVNGVFEIRPGTSILIYGLLATVMHGFRPLFLRGSWVIHWMLCGIFTSAAVLAGFLLLGYQRQAFVPFTTEVWWRVAAPGMAAVVLAPLVFFALAPLLPRRGRGREPGGED